MKEIRIQTVESERASYRDKSKVRLYGIRTKTFEDNKNKTDETLLKIRITPDYGPYDEQNQEQVLTLTEIELGKLKGIIEDLITFDEPKVPTVSEDKTK